MSTLAPAAAAAAAAMNRHPWMHCAWHWTRQASTPLTWRWVNSTAAAAAALSTLLLQQAPVHALHLALDPSSNH
jgi:hypothetical protein